MTSSTVWLERKALPATLVLRGNLEPVVNLAQLVNPVPLVRLDPAA
jgi:hypothetical protein